ncbi:LOW QUALITY PROTEIN: regulator of G-protein signaling 18 [Bombina bombina]|uniref:LOW QUALITY PROTEIN: regulator of G-protein signaling 18 n=1 Tax=Bombina bombina TaxID=8345 RepID=UPI00235A5E98|nr:LOW QUALITY PROTEIN: regulator of G-protein signaling 18 [Bombina bombina]
MENVLLLFPQLNFTASSAHPHFKTFKAFAKDGLKKDILNRHKDKSRGQNHLSQKSGSHEYLSSNKSEHLTCITRVSPEEAMKWGESFDKLLSHKDGLEAFKKFLKMEFSDENIEFWLACEDYKTSDSINQLQNKSKIIYEKYIQKESPLEVNIDFATKEITQKNIENPTRSSFDQAQRMIYGLMEKDSYARFLKCDIYLDLLKGKQICAPAPSTRRRSRSFTISDFQNENSDFGIWL